MRESRSVCVRKGALMLAGRDRDDEIQEQVPSIMAESLLGGGENSRLSSLVISKSEDLWVQ